MFLAPMLLILVLVAGWPLFRTIWFGFTNANLADLSKFEFVGFDNYLAREDGVWIGLLADPEWWQAVWNTIYFAVISVTVETVLGMIIALVLNASFPGRAIVRAAVLIPWAVPTIVSAKMWSWMLNDQVGIINHALLGLGLISQPLAWTASPDLAMISVIMVDVWKTTPFMALLLLAALQMLPSDCYEAAKVDGIHPVKVFFKVTLPLIRPAVMVAVIFRTLDALRIFDLIYVLTSNNKDTMSMSVYARQQLVDFQEVGYGSAASTTLFMIVALCIILYMVVGRVRFDKE
jgi:trehalose/maltose transport system permease protein